MMLGRSAQIRVRPVRLTEVIRLFLKGTLSPKRVKWQIDAVYAVMAAKFWPPYPLEFDHERVRLCSILILCSSDTAGCRRTGSFVQVLGIFKPRVHFGCCQTPVRQARIDEKGLIYLVAGEGFEPSTSGL
jgi:hypothetical protein